MELSKFVDNQDLYFRGTGEEDMSPEQQMIRIDAEIQNILGMMQRQQIYDYQNPLKLMKQGFTHVKKIGGLWSLLEIDDTHKQIFLDKLKAVKIGLRGGITKIENAKKGDKEDIRIYWK